MTRCAESQQCRQQRVRADGWGHWTVVHDEQHNTAWSRENHRSSSPDPLYYRIATRLARTHGSAVVTAVDVGLCTSPFLESIDWVSNRTAINLDPGQMVRGEGKIRGDFLQFDPSVRFDLVFCFDVLERMEKPADFFRKLLRLGDLVIVSVPYRRRPTDPEWDRPYDPIDEVILQRWARRRWVESEIVEDEGARVWSLCSAGAKSV